MSMAFSRSNWERLVELWNLSELASIVSRALASLYMFKMGIYEPEINLRLLHNIEKMQRNPRESPQRPRALYQW